MRRVKPHDFRTRPDGAIVTISVRDYRLMLAVVRAADKWVGPLERAGFAEIKEALKAFNAGGKRK